MLTHLEMKAMTFYMVKDEVFFFNLPYFTLNQILKKYVRIVKFLLTILSVMRNFCTFSPSFL